MNLYEIRFRHYAPKDSKEGILTYLVAENDKRVYDWLRSEPKVDDFTLYNSWAHKDSPEDGDYEDGFEERIIECSGDMYDDYSEVDDLYYGATQYGWKLAKENISVDDATIIKELGVKIEVF